MNTVLIIRYFVPIPEAVSLVLQAVVCAKGGELFAYDMGEPVKINTLTRNMIKLCGLQPDVDDKIEYTGMCPCGKLYKEKLLTEEDMEKIKKKADPHRPHADYRKEQLHKSDGRTARTSLRRRRNHSKTGSGSRADKSSTLAEQLPDEELFR